MVKPVYAEQKQHVRLIVWPSPQDYNESVQNPRTAFADPELAALTPELTPLGLPKPATGNFATVYKLAGDGREFAVRCFLHPLDDQHSRYSALADHLQKSNLNCCLKFEFIERGIKVRNEFMPIVKMEWARGSSLIEHINLHLGQPAKLDGLADEFKQEMLALAGTGIAHGDLQHGNIFVADSIKLVDYDGIFVPALRGQAANELGHRHYQHPQRTEEFFTEGLDHFSAWIIYLSLRMLARDPDLWFDLQGGDECLLFRHGDYLDPINSTAFRTLEGHSDAQVRAWSKHIRWLLLQGVDSLPGLDTPPVDDPAVPELQPLSRCTDEARQRARALWALGQPWPLPDLLNAGDPQGQSELESPAVGQTSQQPGTGSKGKARFSAEPEEVLVLLIVSIALFLIGSALMTPHTNSDIQSGVFLYHDDSKTLFQLAVSKQGGQILPYVGDDYAAAIAANKQDHLLSNEQLGRSWHVVGHMKNLYHAEDNGAGAFQAAFDAYAKGGKKFTSILGDEARSFVQRLQYSEAAAVAFEALQIDINAQGAGHDDGFGWESSYDSEQSMETIIDSMGHFDENQSANLELYKRIAEFLLPPPYDTHEAQRKRDTALRTFCNALPNTARQQLAEGNTDSARQLVEIFGQCVARVPGLDLRNQLDELKKELLAKSPS